MLGPVSKAYPGPRVNLDIFADDDVQFNINCPAAPTSNDRGLGMK